MNDEERLTIISGGRVIDPANGLDAIRDLRLMDCSD